MIGPIPSFPVIIPERWVSQQLKAGKAIDTFTDPVAKQQLALSIQNLARQQLAEPLATGRILWIDGLQKFCTQTDCLLVNQGVVYIKDMTHLSEAGVMLFTQDFLQVLEH